VNCVLQIFKGYDLPKDDPTIYFTLVDLLMREEVDFIADGSYEIILRSNLINIHISGSI